LGLGSGPGKGTVAVAGHWNWGLAACFQRGFSTYLLSFHPLSECKKIMHTGMEWVEKCGINCSKKFFFFNFVISYSLGVPIFLNINETI